MQKTVFLSKTNNFNRNNKNVLKYSKKNITVKNNLIIKKLANSQCMKNTKATSPI